jgi:hypothetical protein
VSLPTLGEEGAVALQVVLMGVTITMPGAVVLVDPPSSVDP